MKTVKEYISEAIVKGKLNQYNNGKNTDDPFVYLFSNILKNKYSKKDFEYNGKYKCYMLYIAGILEEMKQFVKTHNDELSKKYACFIFDGCIMLAGKHDTTDFIYIFDTNKESKSICIGETIYKKLK